MGKIWMLLIVFGLVCIGFSQWVHPVSASFPSNFFGTRNTYTSNYISIEDRPVCGKFLMNNSDAKPDNISVFVRVTVNSKDMALAVFDINGEIVATTEVKTISAWVTPATGKWNKFNINWTKNDSCLLAKQYYFITAWSKSAGGIASVYYDSSGGEGVFAISTTKTDQWLWGNTIDFDAVIAEEGILSIFCNWTEYVEPEDDIVVDLQNISYYQTGQDIIVNTTIVQGYCTNLSLFFYYSPDYTEAWTAHEILCGWNTTVHTDYSWIIFNFPYGTGWYKLFVNGYDNDSFNFSGYQTICYPVQIPLPLGGGTSQGWNLVSLPKNEVVAKTLVRFVNATQNYTWDQAVTNGVTINFLYGWSRPNQNYVLNTTFDPYSGYWIYLYKNDYRIWVNTTGLSSGGEYTEDDIITSLVVFGSIMALGCVSLLNRKRNKN